MGVRQCSGHRGKSTRVRRYEQLAPLVPFTVAAYLIETDNRLTHSFSHIQIYFTTTASTMSQHQVAPLTSVVFVLREQDALAGCSHISQIISEYLDASHKWSIERAACAGYLTLLDRLSQKELTQPVK